MLMGWLWRLLARWRSRSRMEEHAPAPQAIRETPSEQTQQAAPAQAGGDAAPPGTEKPGAQESETAAPPRRVKTATSERRAQLRGVARARREVADITNDLLNRLAHVDLRSNSEHRLAGLNEARELERLMGCDFFLLHEVIDEHEVLHGGGGYCILNPTNDEVELAEICWPLDEAIVSQQDYGFKFQRVQSITAKEARGEASMFTTKMLRVSVLELGDNGRWWADSLVAGMVNGRWVPLDRNMQSEQDRGGRNGAIITGKNNNRVLREEIHRSIAISMSMALSRRYSWHVALGSNPEGVRILLPTNPKGCLALFKNRERGGMSRRGALRHWVRHHYRDADATGLAYVRDHLRGHTEFGWCDLACEIFVSAFDLEKNDEFKREADAWRAARKHNRVRVHLKQRAAEK